MAKKQRVITLATMKGGSGKSTLAVCLAAHWNKQGEKVGLIDADVQRSVIRWQSVGPTLIDIQCETANNKNLGRIIDRMLEEGCKRVVVDTPGFRSPVTETALDRSGLCVIPVRPSPVDFEVAADTVDLIAQIKARGAEGPVAYRFLLSQIIRGSVIARHMRDEMESAGYPLLSAEIGHRVAYAETALMGSTPSLEQPRSSAAKEIRHLADEIDDHLEA